MRIATSKVTAQGQISVPAEVRNRLGLVPGSTIEWDAEGGAVTVKRMGRHDFADIRRALFPDGPPEAKSLDELRAGLGEHAKAKHARR